MMSPRKDQVLNNPPLYVTVSHFFHYIPSSLCHQGNSDQLFP